MYVDVVERDDISLWVHFVMLKNIRPIIQNNELQKDFFTYNFHSLVGLKYWYRLAIHLLINPSN